MKRIIAIAAIVASAQASAFWGWSDSDNTATKSDFAGSSDFAGDASAEMEATFSMTFTGKGRANGDFTGSGDNNSNFVGYGYDAPYYAPYGHAPQAPAAQ